MNHKLLKGVGLSSSLNVCVYEDPGLERERELARRSKFEGNHAANWEIKKMEATTAANWEIKKRKKPT